MTKQALTSTPVITADVLAYLKMLCDVPAKASDTDNQLRWKAAQRDIYLKAEEQHKQAISRENTATNAAENLNIHVRKDD